MWSCFVKRFTKNGFSSIDEAIYGAEIKNNGFTNELGRIDLAVTLPNRQPNFIFVIDWQVTVQGVGTQVNVDVIISLLNAYLRHVYTRRMALDALQISGPAVC